MTPDNDAPVTEDYLKELGWDSWTNFGFTYWCHPRTTTLWAASLLQLNKRANGWLATLQDRRSEWPYLIINCGQLRRLIAFLDAEDLVATAQPEQIQ